MKILVGNTGFVGSNLAKQTQFDSLFNSKNIQDAFGLNPDVLVYSGVRAEKFLANKDPDADFEIVLNAIENIKKINPKKVILISTVDVYSTSINVNENSSIDETKLQPYGKNRLYFEKWVENNFENHLILRLPGLFGINIKKNFIFDLTSIIPSMLNEVKYRELSINNWIVNNYSLQENGFYKLNSLTNIERKILKQQFLDSGFSALNFTDSRGLFQFYNLKNLWKHVVLAEKNNIKKLNLVTEPIGVSEIYFHYFNSEFKNELDGNPPNYDIKTIHSAIFNNNPNYIETKQLVLQDIIEFIKQNNN